MEIRPCPMIQFCLWKELVCYTNMSNPKVTCPTYKKIQDIVLHNNKKNKGKWIRRKNFDCWECSNCKAVLEDFDLTQHNFYYCYHCGSNMMDDSGCIQIEEKNERIY